MFPLLQLSYHIYHLFVTISDKFIAVKHNTGLIGNDEI